MEYRSGQKVVTEFPEELQVSFIMFDIPCKSQTLEPGPRKYLTQEMMKTLRFSFYWKRGIELRHIENLKWGPPQLNPSNLTTRRARRNCRNASGGFWISQFQHGCAADGPPGANYPHAGWTQGGAGRRAAVMERENGNWN